MKPLNAIINSCLKLFCLLECSIEPAMLLIVYLSSFDTSTGNTLQFTFVSSFIDKIAIIVVCIVIKQLIPRFNSPTFLYFATLAASFGVFEFYMNIRSIYPAYILFACIFSFAKIICVYASFRIWAIILIHFLVYAYHIIRMVLLSITDISFPLYLALILLINFVTFDIPYMHILRNLVNITHNQERLIDDLTNIINILPNPIIIYDFNQITATNNAAKQSFYIDDLYKIVNESHILFNELIPCFHFNKRLYLLKAIHLNSLTCGENSILISIIDNTDIIKAEKVAASENAKWFFINTICHQIRTPLSGIECSLSMLEKSILEADSPTIQKCLNMSYASVTNLKHIVDDSVYLCEGAHSTISSHATLFNFSEIIDEVNRVFQYETFSKSLSFTISEHNYPYLLFADKKLILHMIYTLLINSFKYTVTGYVTFTHNIEIIDKNTLKLLIEIEDTGIGMNEDTLNQIDSIFTNIEAKRNENQTSNGIGLYIVKKITALYKGDIKITSKLGVGSHFTLWVFINSVKEQTENKVPFKSEKKEKEVLVVDDNSMNIYALSSMLNRLQVKCDNAHNGEEAVKMFEEKWYELILMDINMPIMNGYEASKIIKEKSKANSKNVMIIACSAQNEPLNSLSSYGIDEWIEKPINFKRLSKIVNEFYDVQ